MYNSFTNSTHHALQIAYSLADYGIPSLPCLPNKKPACPGGFKSATACKKQLDELWALYPGLLVGLPTGALSGIDVLDIDPRHEGDKWLASYIRNLPKTRIHQTQSNGQHFLFRHHEGIRCSVNKIASGVDVRGDGGYFIWWPGTGLAVLNAETLAEWPEWLVKELLPKPRAPMPSPLMPRHNSKYLQVAIRRAIDAVAKAPEGTRNDQLNKEAYSLGRFILSGHMTAQQVATVFCHAALYVGLSRNEIIGTVTSALRARGL